MKESQVQAEGEDPLGKMYTSEVSPIINKWIGYPPNGPWHLPISEWGKVLKERFGSICKANKETFEHFENKNEYSDETLILKAFNRLPGWITKVAISQLEQGYTGPKSWAEVNKKAAQHLGKKITEIFSEDKFSEMLGRLKGIRKALEFIKDVLIPSNDPDEIFQKHSEYIKTCIEANAKGEPIIFIPFDSDYTNPVKTPDDKTQICEATVSVILPVSTEERISLNNLLEYCWGKLKQRENAQDVPMPGLLCGTEVIGCGLWGLSATVGELVKYDTAKGIEHAIYLALNNLAKKIDYWDISSELISTHTNESAEAFFKNETLLCLLHEEGHLLFPEYGLYGETTTDTPAVIKAVEIALENNEYNLHGMIKSILTEYVSEIVTGVSDEALFEGRRDNKSNQVFEGYNLSAVLIINSLTDSGLVRMNREGGIDINATPDNLKLFFADLEMVDAKFYEKDEKTLERIRLAAANTQAIDIIELYRRKIKERLFTKTFSISAEAI